MGIGYLRNDVSPACIRYWSAQTTIGNTNVLFYCNVIAPQYIDSDLVRCLRTFFYRSTTCENVFHKIHYVRVEQRKFQEIRIEILKANGKRVHFKGSKVPTKVVLHFRKD